MTDLPFLEQPSPSNSDYQLGYAAGLHNAQLSGPWVRGWQFKPKQASTQWGIGHRQALEEQHWQPQAPSPSSVETEFSSYEPIFIQATAESAALTGPYCQLPLNHEFP